MILSENFELQISIRFSIINFPVCKISSFVLQGVRTLLFFNMAMDNSPCTLTFFALQFILRFPQMGVPLNHAKVDHFSIKTTMVTGGSIEKQ